jgi:hypothetical protein
MTAPAPRGPNVINNHIAKRAPSRHDDSQEAQVFANRDEAREALDLPMQAKRRCADRASRIIYNVDDPIQYD